MYLFMNKIEYRASGAVGHLRVMPQLKGKQVRILHDLVTVFAEQSIAARGFRASH